MVLNGVTLDRLGDRKALLTAFDRFRRDADATGMMDGIDDFNQQAFGVLTSSRWLMPSTSARKIPKWSSAMARATPRTATTAGRN